MKAFAKRYFVWISLIFLGFSGISFNSEKLIFFVGILLVGALFCVLFRKKLEKRINFKVISICLLVAAVLGILNSQLLIFRNYKKLENYGGEHILRGYVREVTSRENYSSEFVFRVEEVDGDKVNFDILLLADYDLELSRGDFLEFKGEIFSSDSYKYELYIRNDNIYDYPLACEVKDGERIEHLEDEFRIPLMFSNLNAKLSATLVVTMGSKNGSLASALLLGNRELLSEQTLRDFKRAGVYHLLALSGLHVAILIGFLEWILRKLYVPTKIRIVLLGLISLFYISLTGFALSTSRSMLMLWVMYLSILLQRRRDVMTSLFAAVFVIVLIKPSAVLDVGLQLSFLSTFGVICASIVGTELKLIGVDEKKNLASSVKSILRKLALVCVSSLLVFICTLPVIMICFGEVSLATFFSNLFMAAICEVFMILSIFTLLFSKVLAIYPILAFIASIVGNLMTSLVNLISNTQNVMLSLRYPMAEFIVWMLFISFMVMLAVRISRKWFIFVPSIAFVLLMCTSVLAYNGARADFVRAEYYYGDGMVLSSSDGVYICDMSDGSYGDFYEGVLIAKENCFTEIDGVILTHYHSDHIVSLQRFTSSFMVRAVYLPMPQNDSEDLNMRAIVRILSERDVPAYLFNANEPLDILSGELVLSDRSYSAHFVHPSVALTYSNKGQRITLIDKPYFNSYLQISGDFDEYINGSDYLIFGSDGRSFKENFEIFAQLKNNCEVSFADVETFLLSDYQWYLDERTVYFDVHYKKYDLK